MAAGSGARGTVLVVEGDDALGELLVALLANAGYAVSVLQWAGSDAIRVAVNRLEPACVLLDGRSPAAADPSWADAAWARRRGRRVPVVLFTAHGADATEAAC
jgi:FixJ family two-component response regulator